MSQKQTKSRALPETDEETTLLVAAFNLMAEKAYLSGADIFHLTDTPDEGDAQQLMLYASGDTAKEIIALLDTISSPHDKLAHRTAVEHA